MLKNLCWEPGWRTERKLIVFESDDWGSIRMPSTEIFKNLIRAGIDLLSDEGLRYNKNDSLATALDLGSLFDILSAFKDRTNRTVVFTPCSVVANPDFNKIREVDFTEYFFEPFTETLQKYPGCEQSFKLWQEGIEKRLFVPQFHGREHLNVTAWLKALKGGHENTLLAFKNGMWGISTSGYPEIKVEYQAAFDFIDSEDVNYHKKVIVSGLDLFEKLFGYRATYFVPPNGLLSSNLERVSSNAGIKNLSVSRLQIEPVGMGRKKRKIHWLGQTNRNGITYLIRNCFFEPGQKDRDWIDSCMNDISRAFRNKKPSIISSHRVNYIGALNSHNRDNGLFKLRILLKNILRNWPEAEFLTSAELGEIISND